MSGDAAYEAMHYGPMWAALSYDELLKRCEDRGWSVSHRPSRDTMISTLIAVERKDMLATLDPLDRMQAEVAEWTVRFRGPSRKADPMADALIIAEEAGEVCRAVLKRAHGLRGETDWDAQLRDEAGDVLISLLSLAANEGWSLLEEAQRRWEEVRRR